MNSGADVVASDVRKAAAVFGPDIRAAADEIERGRRLPAAIVESMKRAGIFGMAMPRAWGRIRTRSRRATAGDRDSVVLRRFGRMVRDDRR